VSCLPTATALPLISRDFGTFRWQSIRKSYTRSAALTIPHLGVPSATLPLRCVDTLLATVFMSLATMGIGVVFGALIAYTQRNAYK
jgi:hypothetical protein